MLLKHCLVTAESVGRKGAQPDLAVLEPTSCLETTGERRAELIQRVRIHRAEALAIVE